MDLLILTIIILTIFSAICTIETENRMESILFLMITTILTGLLFLYVGAIFAGVFQLLVYSGVLTVLFASSSYLLEIKYVGDKHGEEVGENE